jgi:protein-S-isoprenylcysteine O-methyltransferase Ste14
VKATAPPERANWSPVAAAFASMLAFILLVSLAIGFGVARNWTGVAAVIGAFVLLVSVGLVVERICQRRVRGQR